MPPTLGGMNIKRPQILARPRDYAVAILAESSREERNRLLESCPEQWRDLVRGHVKALWGKTKAYQQYQLAKRLGEREKPSPAPRREDTSFRISDFKKSTPEVAHEHLSELRRKFSRTSGATDARHNNRC